MKVHHRLFLTLAIFIILMSLLFTLLTYIIVRESISVVAEEARGEAMDRLTQIILQHYQDHGRSWTGIADLDLLSQVRTGLPTSLLLISVQDEILYHAGKEQPVLIQRLGLHRPLEWNDERIGRLYYYDQEVAYLSKLRIGIPISVITLLVIGTMIFIAAALMIAYAVSKRLTAPLRRLIPIIERMGQGELGLQAPADWDDEYGQVAKAFNQMSHKLQKIENTRRSMVTDIAHELRTPLTIIRGKLELAQHSGKPIDPIELLPVQDEVIRLGKLVEDLNLLSKAQVDQLPLEMEAVDLPALLAQIADRLSEDAAAQSLTITVHNEPDLPLVQVDPNRITQVFLNLLTNALRYTPKNGRITMKADAVRPPETDIPMIRVTVSDTGPGIKAEHLPHLFDRFYRTDEGRSRSSGGTGLGLAIAKEIVLAHGGTIDVESKLGEGTAFIVMLPSKDTVPAE